MSDNHALIQRTNYFFGTDQKREELLAEPACPSCPGSCSCPSCSTCDCNCECLPFLSAGTFAGSFAYSFDKGVADTAAQAIVGAAVFSANQLLAQARAIQRNGG